MRDCTHVSVCLVAPPFHVPQPLTAAVADPVPVSAYGVFCSYLFMRMMTPLAILETITQVKVLLTGGHRPRYTLYYPLDM